MIRTVAETGSTNADLAAQLGAGDRIAEGDWLIADRQEAGKGRLGRAWHDGAGNFMGSTVVHLGNGDPAPGTLALVAGLAVWEAVSPSLPPPLQPILKWPNDLLIRTAKLAGILLERIRGTVVVGIGVNLVHAPAVEGRETAALSRFCPAPSRDRFAEMLAQSFAVELNRWRAYGLVPVVTRWLAAGHPIGTPLSVGEPGELPLAGTFAGLGHDGALQLRLEDGQVRAIHAGEVRLAEPRKG